MSMDIEDISPREHSVYNAHTKQADNELGLTWHYWWSTVIKSAVSALNKPKTVQHDQINASIGQFSALYCMNRGGN